MSKPKKKRKNVQTPFRRGYVLGILHATTVLVNNQRVLHDYELFRSKTVPQMELLAFDPVI